jgi:hypothetical protein
MHSAFNWIMVYLAVAAIVLLTPALAMTFTDEIAWGAGDFVVAAIILAGGGVALKAIAKMVVSDAPRLAASTAV